jgi:kynureninase
MQEEAKRLTDDLLTWRAEFPILDKTAYLISHSLGAMPRATFQSLQDYAEMWATRGVRAWGEGWWEMPLTVGDEVARIIGAPPASVVMHQNVSICQSLILSCFEPQGKRNKIVYSDLEFPSCHVRLRSARARRAFSRRTRPDRRRHDRLFREDARRD